MTVPLVVKVVVIIVLATMLSDQTADSSPSTHSDHDCLPAAPMRKQVDPLSSQDTKHRRSSSPPKRVSLLTVATT